MVVMSAWHEYVGGTHGSGIVSRELVECVKCVLLGVA